MTDKTDKPTIFVTGASNGIGACLADMAKASGFCVRTTGRSGGDLRKDLMDADAPQVLADFAKGSDMAVLNAAIAPGAGMHTEITVNLLRQMQLALLLLKQNPKVKIAFVGSVISGAIIPAYCAAKAGLAAFARALAAEFPGQILLFHPSGTQSKFMERTGVTHPGHLDRTQAVAGRLFSLLQKQSYPWRRPATWKAWAIDWVAKLALIKGPKPEVFAGGTTLITGAASGLGKAFYTQTKSAIGLDLADADVAADLSQPLPKLPPADRLINCAEANWTGQTLDMPYGEIERLVQINLLSPLALEDVLSPMQIIQISSLSHQLGHPYGAVYAATKSALAIWGQCRGHIVVYPEMGAPQISSAHLGNKSSTRIGGSAKIARQVLKASTIGQRQLVPGLANKVLRVIGRLFPHISTGILARNQRRRLSS